MSYDQYRSVTELDLSSDVDRPSGYKGLLLTTNDGVKDTVVLKITTKSSETVELDFVLSAETPVIILPIGVTKIFAAGGGSTFPSSSRCYGLN